MPIPVAPAIQQTPPKRGTRARVASFPINSAPAILRTTTHPSRAGQATDYIHPCTPANGRTQTPSPARGPYHLRQPTL